MGLRELGFWKKILGFRERLTDLKDRFHSKIGNKIIILTDKKLKYFLSVNIIFFQVENKSGYILRFWKGNISYVMNI